MRLLVVDVPFGDRRFLMDAGCSSWKGYPWQPSQTMTGASVLAKGLCGHIVFPVGDEGPAMRWLSIWLYPTARKQAVSVFLDGQSLNDSSQDGVASL